MSPWRIAPAGAADLGEWAAMRSRLWTEDGLPAHTAEVADALGRPGLLALIARDADAAAMGFAEAALRRDHVNGCEGSPVTFLEGIWVEPAARGRGLGRALADAVAAWGRGAGAAEFASDAALDDPAAHAFHRAIGFVESERVVFFRRAAA